MSNRLSAGDFKSVVAQMCADQKKGNFTPILEADVVAHLYHLFLSCLKIPASNIHLSSRVEGAKDSKKRPDIVLGKVSSNERLEIDARTIIEVKIFSEGLQDGQCRNRAISIIESDIPKLRSYKKKGRALFQLLYDERDFLSRGGGGDRKQYINRIPRDRSNYTTSIKILWARKIDKEWSIEYLNK